MDQMTSRAMEAIDDARKLIPQLAGLLPQQDGRGPSMGTIGRHSPDGSEPWNVAVADAYWNLWFGVGAVVGHLRHELGITAAPRVVGTAALDVMVNLIPAAPEAAVKFAVRELERWADLARRIPAIDETEPWVPVPSPPMVTPPACPFCRTYALRMQRRRGQVRCFLPNCKDGDGQPTRARMEPGRMTGEARLVFGDGTMMHWAGETQ